MDEIGNTRAANAIGGVAQTSVMCSERTGLIRLELAQVIHTGAMLYQTCLNNECASAGNLDSIKKYNTPQFQGQIPSFCHLTEGGHEDNSRLCNLCIDWEYPSGSDATSE